MPVTQLLQTWLSLHPEINVLKQLKAQLDGKAVMAAKLRLLQRAFLAQMVLLATGWVF